MRYIEYFLMPSLERKKKQQQKTNRKRDWFLLPVIGGCARCFPFLGLLANKSKLKTAQIFKSSEIIYEEDRMLQMEDGCTIEVESGPYEWEPSRVLSRSPGLISLSSVPAALVPSRNFCISPATLLKGQTVVNGHRGAPRPSGRVAVHKSGKRELGRKCGSCHRTCEADCFGSSSDVLDQIQNRNHLRRKGLCCCVVWSYVQSIW